MQAGGDLLALGLPAWQSPLYQIQGKWISRESYEAEIAAQRPQHIVEDFDRADLSRWTRSTGEASGKAEYELADADHGKALHVKIAHLGGWETLTSPALAQPFPPGHTLTCFRAKGGPRTRQLALEWREAGRLALDCDGGFDPAVEGLHAAAGPVQSLAGARAWREPRHFHPAKAASCCVGLAMSHTALEGDAHEYWFDDLGTAPNPFGEPARRRSRRFPCWSPSRPVTNASRSRPRWWSGLEPRKWREGLGACVP